MQAWQPGETGNKIMSEEHKAPAIIQERSELETARLTAQPEERPHWEAYDDELGVHAPATDAEKSHAELIASLPHETRGTSESLENLAQLKEANEAAVAGQRWQNQAELGRIDERYGRILHAHQLMQLLWKCGLVCVFTECDVRGLRSLKGDQVARQRRELFKRSMAGLVVQGSALVSIPRPQYVTWIQIPYMIEYSVMRFDDHGLPTSEKYRGWRTVLIELIRSHFLSEAAANEVFGQATGPAARRWQEIMQQIRLAQGIC